MQFWPELTYKLYANSNVSCMRNVRGPTMVQELGNQIAQENLNHPLTYEQLMNRHRDQFTKLNISLCWECFIPIGKEEEEHCNECISL